MISMGKLCPHQTLCHNSELKNILSRWEKSMLLDNLIPTLMLDKKIFIKSQTVLEKFSGVI